MFLRMLITILVLPGIVLIFVPALILWITTDPETGLTVAGRDELNYWTGIAAGTVGLILAVSTVRLFLSQGGGTPAPWDPPPKLVIAGPYRHVRNPMITAVLLILIGESLIFQSSAIGTWMLVFFVVNGVYFPLSEEKGLEERFGDDYRRYKENVPRWIPRMNPWFDPVNEPEEAEEEK
ncbi:MAG: isoprenylcysteine carboxylmethyltransferase family protein [Alphaproteobacteria bacterium]|nr:isoprenylcysteine carboxylmethyltransferase family protein [Alphaproteobacteria bacterium]